MPNNMSLTQMFDMILVSGKSNLVSLGEWEAYNGNTYDVYNDTSAKMGEHLYYFDMESGELMMGMFTIDIDVGMTFISQFTNGLVSKTFTAADFIIPGCSDKV